MLGRHDRCAHQLAAFLVQLLKTIETVALYPITLQAGTRCPLYSAIPVDALIGAGAVLRQVFDDMQLAIREHMGPAPNIAGSSARRKTQPLPHVRCPRSTRDKCPNDAGTLRRQPLAHVKLGLQVELFVSVPSSLRPRPLAGCETLNVYISPKVGMLCLPRCP